MTWLILCVLVTSCSTYQFTNQDTVQAAGIVYRVLSLPRTTVVIPRFQRLIASSLRFHAFGAIYAEPIAAAQETRTEWEVAR